MGKLECIGNRVARQRSRSFLSGGTRILESVGSSGNDTAVQKSDGVLAAKSEFSKIHRNNGQRSG
jgi:hypothetical protein